MATPCSINPLGFHWTRSPRTWTADSRLFPRRGNDLCSPAPCREGPFASTTTGSTYASMSSRSESCPPGGDPELLEAAAGLCSTLLDRRLPLCELWFLTGLAHGRVGLLLKPHHTLADGTAAVALMTSLFDSHHQDREERPTQQKPTAMPTAAALVADNLSQGTRRISRAARAALIDPAGYVRGLRTRFRVALRLLNPNRAPRTSLNQPARPGLQVRYLRLSLAGVKESAHASGGKVNDAVLAIWSGGLRRLLLYRGEQVDQLERVTSIPSSLRHALDTGTGANQFGAMSIPLPIGEPDVRRRLNLIVSRTREAKAVQHPETVIALLATHSRPPPRPLLRRSPARR